MPEVKGLSRKLLAVAVCMLGAQRATDSAQYATSSTTISSLSKCHGLSS